MTVRADEGRHDRRSREGFLHRRRVRGGRRCAFVDGIARAARIARPQTTRHQARTDRTPAFSLLFRRARERVQRAAHARSGLRWLGPVAAARGVSRHVELDALVEGVPAAGTDAGSAGAQVVRQRLVRADPCERNAPGSFAVRVMMGEDADAESGVGAAAGSNWPCSATG